jgi:hypothetical protein
VLVEAFNKIAGKIGGERRCERIASKSERMIHKGISVLISEVGKDGSVKTMKAEDQRFHLEVKQADFQRAFASSH